MRLWVLAFVLVGCAGNLHIDPYAPASGGVIEAGGALEAGAVPDVRCAGAPATGPAQGFRSWRQKLVAKLARPDHRGYDLISATDEPQVLAGKLAYGVIDKSLAHEDVELFACIAGQWQGVGRTRSDGNGRFALALAPAQRLPVGLRDIYASVVADRSGVRFLAYVAPRDSQLVISDVDGTLTASENLFVKAVVLGRNIKPQPGAAAALRAVAERGYQVVYVTARPDRYTDATRQWLGNNGFPRGPVRLADAWFVMPGSETIAYKQHTLKKLGFPIAAGVGNRKSDVAAYAAVGVPADRIFIKLPEYKGELGTALTAGAAVGFGAYSALPVP
ncbi:MAG TPA: phosphatase domain-containing protein [Kofleriaceae bacterium]|nr:phosphatase domain-containing protein [Kofleriaceae bacterium]